MRDQMVFAVDGLFLLLSYFTKHKSGIAPFASGKDVKI